MSTGLEALEVSWYWDWVPAADGDDEQRTAWTAFVASTLDGWVGEKVAAARAAWPADAPEDFPFTVDEMGSAVARDLLERADELPRNCRLIWGAGFLGDEARWLPLLVVAEFHPARPEDPAYLMGMVCAEGFDEYVREPTVDYVTTDHGDGVRVLALADNGAEGLHARVNAALRLERREPGAPAEEVDVLLTTRVGAMDQIAVIGPGVEAVMHLIATQFAARPGDGVPALRFAGPAGRDLS
jgi:hypothetical protein